MLAVTACTAWVAAALAPAGAQAALYSVKACDAAPDQIQSKIFGSFSLPGRITANRGCPSNGTPGRGLRVNSIPNVGLMRNGERAEFSFFAPADTTIARVDLAAHAYRLQDSRGDSRWSVGFFETTNDLAGRVRAIDGCPAYAGKRCDLPWPKSDRIAVADSIDMGGRRSFRFMAMCGDDAPVHDGLGCDSTNLPSDVENSNAWMAVHRATVTLNDLSHPVIRDLGGSAFDGGWKQGIVRAQWTASDTGSGRSLETLTGGGITFLNRASPCDSTNPSPCPTTAQAGTADIDTRRLNDGTYGFKLVDRDYSGNTVTHAWDLAVDNHVPAEASSIAVEGGSAWRGRNGFRVTWANPAQGSGSPVSGAVYRLCNLATGACSERASDGLASTSVDAPSPGEYELRVALSDAAGRGDWSDPVTLRFDPTVPAAGVPARSNGWVSAAEAKSLSKRIEFPADVGRPISGIAGYSVGLDDEDPDETIDAPGDPAEYHVPEEKLTEGRHVLKARSISGAGVASTTFGSAGINVDLTAPSVDVEGLPTSEWSPGPVSVRLTGADQLDLSGMEGAPETRPVEEGAYVQYRVDDNDPVRIRGGEAPLAIEDEGEHTVTYQAFDAAGNPSPERSLSIKIDPTAPGRAKPAAPKGWLSKLEAAGYDQSFSLDAGAVRPRSGIKGYSVTTDGSEPDETVDVEGEAPRLPLHDLPEGVTTVKARAISGAGVASELVGDAEVRVDRGAPSATADGVPTADWSRDAVELHLRGTDEDELSGMSAAPDGEPVEDGAYISYRIDGRPVERRAGAEATVTAGDDGRHRVTYRAVDVAGNESPEGSVSFKIDRTAPETVAFHRPDRGDPRRVVASIADRGSGVRDGTIELRKVGDDSWRALATSRSGDELVTRLDEAGLDRLASYQLRARVHDVAGNEAVGDRFVDGSTAIVSGNLRVATRLSAAWMSRSRTGREVLTRSLALGYGKRGTVNGRLTDEGGRPIAGATVSVRSRLRVPGAPFRTEASVRTGSDGRFTYAAPAGASRTVRFVYAGSSVDRPSTAEVNATVAAALTLASDRNRVRNGRSVVFSGRLLGQPIPASGVKVDLQVFYHGRWRTFATPRAAANGSFTESYRFQSTHGTVTYRFRARLKPETAYPYGQADSKTVGVTVWGA